MLKEQMALKVYDLASDKDLWDTIPAVIYSSIRTLHKNCSNIKRFVESLESQIKVLTKKNGELEQKVSTLEDRCDHHDRRGAFLFLYSFNLFARQRNEHLKLQRKVNDVQELQRCCIDEWVKETTGENVDCEHISTDLIRKVSCEQHNKNEEKQNDFKELDNRLESCRLLTEENQNRLLSWRQSLLTATHMTEELGRQLVAAQYQLKHIDETRIEMGPIEQKFDDLDRQHFESIQLVETNILNVEEQLNQCKVDLQGHMQRVLDDMDTQLVDNGTKMLAALHERLDPMAQYINQLHYKQDAANEMLKNTETTTLPNLELRLSMISADADKQHQWSADAVSKLSISSKEMQNKMEELALECEHIKTALRTETHHLQTNVINQFRDEFHGHVDESSGRLMRLEDNHTDLHQATNDLEERVAKWISTRPLPVKVSEARLYSLETILHRTMADRMKWEENVEAKLQQILSRPRDERLLVPLPAVPPGAVPSPRPSPGNSFYLGVATPVAVDTSKESLITLSPPSAERDTVSSGFNIVRCQRGVSPASGKTSRALTGKNKVLVTGEKKNLPSLALSVLLEPSDTNNVTAELQAGHPKSLLHALR